MIHMWSFNKFEENNLKFLTQKNIEYTIVQITETGYKKSILDKQEGQTYAFSRERSNKVGLTVLPVL